jgi:hypothetical protein
MCLTVNSTERRFISFRHVEDTCSNRHKISRESICEHGLLHSILYIFEFDNLNSNGGASVGVCHGELAIADGLSALGSAFMANLEGN